MDFFNKKIEIITKITPQIPRSNINTSNLIPENVNYHNPNNQMQQDKEIENNNVLSKHQNTWQEDKDFFNNKLSTKISASGKNEKKIDSPKNLPKKVDKYLKLPVNKNNHEYNKVKEDIISNIEDGICELEYFNIEFAKVHLETALYYLRNIQESD